MSLSLPRRWSNSELQAARDLAEANYINEQGVTDVRDKFVAMYQTVEPIVEAALDRTENLLDIDAHLQGDPMSWQTLRFFCGPPISEENLWTFVGKKFNGRLPPAVAAKMAEVLRSGVDPVRFPWVAGNLPPSREERRIGVVSTSMLLAQAQFLTNNRGEVAQVQEGAVRLALESAGYSLDAEAREAADLKSGSFAKEKTLFNKKCDAPVRLRDGRLLTLECKVSNTPKNSWKRLNQEAIGKSNTWREHLGDKVVTGCVISGVFDLAALEQAQRQGLYIFWQHSLDELANYVAAN